MSVNSRKEISPLRVLFIFFFAIPISIYLFSAYVEILIQAVAYIRVQYQIPNRFFWLFILAPAVMFFSFGSSYSKAVQYVSLNRSSFATETEWKKWNRLEKAFLGYTATLLLFYNIFCIYVYINDVGQNPFVENVLIKYVIGYSQQ